MTTNQPSILHPVQHDHIKYVEFDLHFIREEFDSGLICTPYVLTKEQLADILTEWLANSKICLQAGDGKYLFPSLRREC